MHKLKLQKYFWIGGILLILMRALPLLMTNIEVIIHYENIIKDINLALEQKRTNPVPVLTENAECGFNDNITLPQNFSSRRFSIVNFQFWQELNCASGAEIDILILLHSLGISSNGNLLHGKNEDYVLVLDQEYDSIFQDIQDLKRYETLWMIPILEDTFVKLGGYYFSTNPQLSFQYLSIADELDVNDDEPMIEALLLNLIQEGKIDTNNTYVNIDQLRRRAFRFPAYIGPRLIEYINLAVPQILSTRDISLEEEYLSNWAEYLIYIEELGLAENLFEYADQLIIKSVPLQLQYADWLHKTGEIEAAKVAINQILEKAPGNIAVSSLENEFSGKDDNEFSRSSCEEQVFLPASGSIEVQFPGQIDNWKWYSWANVDEFGPALFKGWIENDVIRIQGLWSESDGEQILPRAGYISEVTFLAPASKNVLCFQYRTTGIEGNPEIYIMTVPEETKIESCFLDKTHGVWVTQVLEIENPTSNEIGIQLIFRSLSEGTTWFKHMQLFQLSD